MDKKSRKESANPSKVAFETLHVEGKTPPTAVLLLECAEDDILIKSCESVHAFAEKGDDNKATLLKLGILQPLCKLITHTHKMVRRYAFMALGTMSTNGEVKNALKKIDAIPSIIEKLAPDEETIVHEYATLSLASLSVDFSCKIQIFESNGLPPLIQLLSSSDPDVQKNSVEIIYNVVQDYQSRQAFQGLGGIPPLLNLLKSDYPVIQHLALKVLQCITLDTETCNTFRELQGFEKLMDILHNSELNDLHAETLDVVVNCLWEKETTWLIHNDGGLTRLMEFLPVSNGAQIQCTTINCFDRIAQYENGRRMLHQMDLEKYLIELMTATDATVLTCVCQAMASMCFYPASRESFKDTSAVTALIEFLGNENLMLVEAAAKALSCLTHDHPHNALALFEAGADEMIVQLLKGSCPKAVAHSAAVLCNIARLEVTRLGLLSHGAIEALVEPLKSEETDILINATRCLATLACDEEARTRLRAAGGIEPLLNLLHSNDKHVAHNACFAVKICANDYPTAVELCKFGALEILQDFCRSVNRRNKFSESALASLLNNNLSIKYSHTGYLSSNDIITYGFYDAGKACPGERVLSLEELLKTPVDEHLAILVVNITADESEEAEEHLELDTKKDHKGQKKKKEEEKHKEPSESPPLEKTSILLEDPELQLLVKEAKDLILPIADEEEQFAALAGLVSDAMGGWVTVEQLHAFPWVLHLSELKWKLQSNVVPIGMVTMGFYCHRALLFKCLADAIGLSCTLVRGDYNRAWNEVLLYNESLSNDSSCLEPCYYVVDLIHHPGRLLPRKTPAAVKYQTV